MSQQPLGAPGNQAPSQGLDLSAVRTRRQPAPPAQAAPAGPPAAGGDGGLRLPSLVLDVSEETFNSVVEMSLQVPVVVDLRTSRSQASQQLSPILGKLIAEYDGRLVLASVDIDANPQIQQLFQAQSAPTVVAIVKGQPVPLFQGALPEEQVRQYLEELLQVAESNGVNGVVTVSGAEEPAPLPPKHQEAYDALERDDLDGAESAFKKALAEAPADAEAKAGLAQVQLLQRTRGLDLEQARAEAAADPADIEAGLRVADLDVAGGHVDDSFARLLDLIRKTAGADRQKERDVVRLRLLDLFEVVGISDPRVLKARSALTRALF